MATQKQQLEAFLAFGKALFGDAFTVADQPKAGAAVTAPPSAEMVGVPSIHTAYGVDYFSDDQIAKGEGYRCHAKVPCGRLLKGAAKAGSHQPGKGHKAAK